ncbi:hypothetical protein [Streptomyces sp. NPDC053079]|uniref:hypothetical protein n=1 Tax=Streptomyces sp. NPDC053079 TaxID=3365697 RepID=UPI0037D1FBE9
MTDDVTHYNARTAILPDGIRITVAFKVDSGIGELSESEFIARYAPDQLRPLRHLHAVPGPRPEPDSQQP